MQQRSGTRASLWQLTLELDLWQDDEYPPDFSDETHTDAVLELHFWDRIIEDEVFEAWPAGEGTCWERMLLFIRKAWKNIPCSNVVAVSSVRVLYRLFKDKASIFWFEDFVLQQYFAVSKTPRNTSSAILGQKTLGIWCRVWHALPCGSSGSCSVLACGLWVFFGRWG